MFWKKSAISVIDHEWVYKASSHWQTALAISLRSQNQYEDKPPYSPEDPPARAELRTYARIMYRHKQGERLNWTHTFRPELRQFFTPDWHEWPSSPLQVHFRGGSKMSYALSEANTTQLIVANPTSYYSHRNGFRRLHLIR